MYRKEKRIPTIIALLLIFFGIGSALYLDGTIQTLTTKASLIPAPSDVHFTNISDNSITVSYLTNEKTIGAVKVNGPNKKLTLIDDQDIPAGVNPRYAHVFTIRDLNPESIYSITIESGNICQTKKCPEFIQRTGVKLTSVLDLPPVSGQVIDSENTPVEGALIYLIAGRAAPISARSDKLGMFVIPLNNLRTQDLSKRPELSPEDLIQITIKSTVSQYASIVTNLDKIKINPQLDKIQLGKSYNFQTKQDAGEDNKPQVLGNRSEFKLSPTPIKVISKSGIDILFPEHKLDTTIDRQPKLRGIGIPGDKIRITIQSKPQTAIVTVSDDGTWECRPKLALEPGNHIITIQGKDKNGKTVTKSSQFVVLKSGESVLGEATPSGTLTPTLAASVTPSVTPDLSITPTPTSMTASISATPTQTPTPTNTPTPSETPIPEQIEPTLPAPRAGNTSWTKLFIGSGLTLILVGIKLLF